MSAGLWNRGIEGGWNEGKDRSLSKGLRSPLPLHLHSYQWRWGGVFNRFVKASAHKVLHEQTHVSIARSRGAVGDHRRKGRRIKAGPSGWDQRGPM